MPSAKASDTARTHVWTSQDAAAAGDPWQPGWFQYAIEHRAQQCLIGDIGIRLHDNMLKGEWTDDILFGLLAAQRQR